jgi:hypothetical protein
VTYRIAKKHSTVAAVSMLAAAMLLAMPAMGLAKTDVGGGGTLGALADRPAAQVAKFAPAETPTIEQTPAKTATPIVVPKPAPATGVATTGGGGTSGGSVVPAATQTAATSAQTELARARAILAGYVAKYPILKGTTVTFGTTPGGYQAVAYYTAGRILIKTDHTTSLERIIAHEIWHIIDYRDNGTIDWGENVPPN